MTGGGATILDMLTRALVALVMLVIVGSLACGNPGPVKPPGGGGTAGPVIDAPPPDAMALDHDYPRLAERAVKLFEEVAELFRASGEDCAAAATKLVELRVRYADVVVANAKVLHEGRTGELKVALAKYDDKFDAAAKAIVQSPTMAKCSQDPPFTNAFDDLVAAPS